MASGSTWLGIGDSDTYFTAKRRCVTTLSACVCHTQQRLEKTAQNSVQINLRDKVILVPEVGIQNIHPCPCGRINLKH